MRAGEDRELLAGVVADDADLAADLRAVRVQRQRARLDEAQLLRVVAIDAEVVDRDRDTPGTAALPRD